MLKKLSGKRVPWRLGIWPKYDLIFSKLSQDLKLPNTLKLGPNKYIHYLNLYKYVKKDLEKKLPLPPETFPWCSNIHNSFLFQCPVLLSANSNFASGRVASEDYVGKISHPIFQTSRVDTTDPQTPSRTDISGRKKSNGGENSIQRGVACLTACSDMIQRSNLKSSFY